VPTEIERLYREHRAGLVRLVERELHDPHDAEDVVQTAFVDAQRALERGTIPRNPRAWLATIALNAGRRLRRRRLNAEPLEEYAAQEASEQPEFRAALASLPREQRTAVVYRDVLGLSYGETAEEMGTSVNAVTMLLHRGRRRLRETLGVTPFGMGLWRWGRRLGMPQVAVAKGVATVVVAAGLATTGVVAARAVAPPADTAAAVAPVTRTPRTARTSDSVLPHRPAHHHAKTKTGGSGASAAPASTGEPSEAVTPAPALSSTPEVTTSPPRSTLEVSTAHLPTLSIPTTPATVAVSTPITTVTVTIPTVTTATVTTPITTVTLPIP
jgi:RNA polymerase sigma-70 factor, ECF subfamily